MQSFRSGTFTAFNHFIKLFQDGEEEELLRHAADNGVEEAGDVLTHICSTGQCKGAGDGEEFMEN